METRDTIQDRVRARDAAMRLLNRLTTGAALSAIIGVGLFGAVSAYTIPGTKSSTATASTSTTASSSTSSTGTSTSTSSGLQSSTTPVTSSSSSGVAVSGGS